MIRVIQGFRLSTRDAVDSRLVLTKEQMRTMNDNQMPDKYFAVCLDDGLLYTYNKEAELDDLARSDSGTGKFKQYANDEIKVVEHGYYYDGTFYADKEHKVTILGYEYKLYFDMETFKLYAYTNELKYKCINDIPYANDTDAGIMKLYNELGANEDGTMTQLSISTELNKKFTVQAGSDEDLVFMNSEISTIDKAIQ